MGGAGVLRNSVSFLLTNMMDHYDKPEKQDLRSRDPGGGKGEIAHGLGIPQVGTCAKRPWHGSGGEY